jgi:hypothetical protein
VAERRPARTVPVDSSRSSQRAVLLLLLLLADVALAAPFAPLLDLRSLLPLQGGDGSAGFVLKGISSRDRSGFISGAGDVNGDGVDDIIIGAHQADPDGRAEAGECYVVFGRSEFPASFRLSDLLPENGGDGSDGFVLRGASAGDHAGMVRDAGDVNHDGFADVIIGAVAADPGGRSQAGAAFVVFGRSAFPPVIELADLNAAAGGDGSAGFVIEGVDEGDRLGIVTGAGDVDADGIDDLMVAAVEADPAGREGAGEVYVVFGRDSGFPANLDLAALHPDFGGDGTDGFVVEGAGAEDRLRVSVRRAGDVNGDAVDDIILGAEYADPGGRENAGEAYVLFGRASGFAGAVDLRSLAEGDGSDGFVLQGIDPFDESGRTANGIGDLNGDGVDDIVVGAYVGDPNGVTDAGESYVLFGRTSGFPPVYPLTRLLAAAGGDGTEGFVIQGAGPDDRASFPMYVGDIDADGISDLIIGAHKADAYGRIDAGLTYVIYGRRSGFPAAFELARLMPEQGGDGAEGFVILGANAGDEMGYSVSGVGDVNGDGVADIILGALRAGFFRPEAGRSYVIFGRDSMLGRQSSERP